MYRVYNVASIQCSEHTMYIASIQCVIAYNNALYKQLSILGYMLCSKSLHDRERNV